jgi:hypothetical protein
MANQAPIETSTDADSETTGADAADEAETAPTRGSLLEPGEPPPGLDADGRAESLDSAADVSTDLDELEPASFEDDAHERDFLDEDDPFRDGDSAEARSVQQVIVHAFNRESSDEFLRAVLSGLVSVASQDPASTRVGAESSTVDAGAALADARRQLVPLLRAHVRSGTSEADVFADLSRRIERKSVQGALPLLATIAARALVRPLLGVTSKTVTPALARALVAAALVASSRLIESADPRALRALPALAARLGRHAVRDRLHARTLPEALTRAAARLSRRPDLARRLASRVTGSTPMESLPERAKPRATPRRLRIRGPIEIVIYER